jgi:tetratricopeptide (TPR) repeat protein
VIGFALLAQLAITTSGPDTGSACLPIALSAALRIPGTAVVSIEPPSGPGIQLLRHRVSTRVEPDGSGQPSTIVEASADVATSLVGRVDIPGFAATIDGRRITSAPFVVMVRSPIMPPPVVLVRARLDDLIARQREDSIVVGQQLDYTVDVMMNEPARGRLRRNPTFFPPEMASVLAYDVSAPVSVPRRSHRCFEALSYRRALFPLFPGRVAIPPAVLTYSLPLSSSFFSREESFEIHSDSVVFSAIEPPARGRPSEYAGAVGSLRVSSRIAGPSARMGDPVLLTLRVDAVGNVKLLPRPTLSLPWAIVVAGDERVRVDSSGPRISGSKEYDWILTPRVAGVQTIPSIQYPFFDPTTRQYAVMATAPIALHVTAGALASSDTVAGPHLPVRILLRAERSAPLITQPLYWLALLLAPIPATVRRVFRRTWWRTRDDSAVKRLRLYVDSTTVPSPRQLRRLFLDALRERVPAVGQERDPLARVLRRAGVSDDAALEAEALLTRLDGAAFSGAGDLDARAVREAAEIVEMVHREALPPSASRVTITGASVLLLTTVMVLSALPDDATRSFDDGVRAYRHEQFAIAERRFAKAASQAPRAVDAWMNLGAAAWEAADTAQAARAWHQALRLDPLDAEARERIGEVQALGPRSTAYVAPISIDLIAWFVLALWIGAWLLLALPYGWRPSAARGIAGGAIALALAGLAGLLELNDRLGARDLAVVTHSRPLLASPSADGAPISALGAGEAGRLGARESGWVHITLDEARSGWVPADAVVLVDPVMSLQLTGLTPAR